MGNEWNVSYGLIAKVLLLFCMVLSGKYKALKFFDVSFLMPVELWLRRSVHQQDWQWGFLRFRK
jgi:hypothetical protein